MRTQVFKNYIGDVHEIEMERVLNVPRNTFERKGIDLLDSVKGIEVKGCLIYSKSEDSRKKYIKWTLFDHELSWHETYGGLPLYCALGSYELSIPIEKIGLSDLCRLEALVSKREFWVVPWDWTLEFPIKKGVHHNYRNLRRKPIASSGIPHMPKTKHTREIRKGMLHFTEGIDMKYFDL